MSVQPQRKIFYCNTCRMNGVTTECYWDQRMKSNTGIMIPQEVATNQNHSCPFKQKKGATIPNAPAAAQVAPARPAPQVSAQSQTLTAPQVQQSTAPRPAPAPASVDIPNLVAALKPAIDQAVTTAFTVQIKQQLDRIEQAVAGLLMNTPTGASQDTIPDEPLESDEEQNEEE